MSVDSPAVQRACAFLAEVAEMLREKNRSYGDSIATPIHVFSKLDTVEGVKLRLDDKLKRIALGKRMTGDNDVRDIVGYLAFLATLEEGSKA